MKRQILLDTNILIGAYDHDPNNPKHLDAKKIMRELLQDDDAELVITSLVRYEVLRGLQRTSFEKMTNKLNKLTELRITVDVADTAAQIYRKRIDAGHKSIVICEQCACDSSKCDKRNFDILHFATSCTYDLSLETYDNRLSRLSQYVDTQIQT